MAKRIVICCDGTGNQLDETYSNVVKIYSVLQRNTNQLLYYDPGIGTFSYSDVVIPLVRKIKKGIALGLGLGLEDNVSQAYSFLMENFEPGDTIYLFGFSRGAYTVRVLAGLLKQMGLLQKGCQNLIPYAWDSYRLCHRDDMAKVSDQFKRYFSRDVSIKFLGVWDTVSSIGLLVGYKSYPHTKKNDLVEVVRHAIAIDERRRFYRQNLFEKTLPTQDVKQVWFAGSHSDVGGSYSLNESGLAQISLSWMIREASSIKDNLDFNPEMVARVIPETDNTEISAPSFKAPSHKSLNGGWWILEIWPKRDRLKGKTKPPMGAPRKMYVDSNNSPITPVIHSSVRDRMKDASCNYAPPNLQKNYLVEP